MEVSRSAPRPAVTRPRSRAKPQQRFSAISPRCKTQVGGGEVDAVKAPRVFDQRRVAALRNILDDRGDYGIDIRRGLSLCVEKLPEVYFKPGCTGRQSDWY